MTQLETLKCLIGKVKEIKYTGIVSNRTRIVLKRTCKEYCENSALCDELVTMCNTQGFKGSDFGWRKDVK